jgi:hypothetical protein
MKKKMIPTKERRTTPITIRMPVDVLEDLKRVAPLKGMSGYQPLIKYYGIMPLPKKQRRSVIARSETTKQSVLAI